jgi:hypothetical protein
MLLAIYKYYANSMNDASSSVFMSIGGFTKFLKEAGLIAIDSNEKLVNYKLEFPFNLTLTTKAKFSKTVEHGKSHNNMFNTFSSYKHVI